MYIEQIISEKKNATDILVKKHPYCQAHKIELTKREKERERANWYMQTLMELINSTRQLIFCVLFRPVYHLFIVRPSPSIFFLFTHIHRMGHPQQNPVFFLISGN